MSVIAIYREWHFDKYIFKHVLIFVKEHILVSAAYPLSWAILYIFSSIRVVCK